MSAPYGVAGRLAAAFVHSKLTPLVIIASLLLGLYAGVALPREEEPQIIVPMIDVFVDLPGASPSEVEQRLTRPVEKLLWEVPGLEYLYSTSSPGRAMIIARFYVGEDDDRALVRVNQKLAAARDLFDRFITADVAGTGAWQVRGTPVVPHALACPTVEFVSATDRIVPAATAAGLADQSAQRRAGLQQMLLAHDLVEGARTHPYGQGAGGRVLLLALFGGCGEQIGLHTENPMSRHRQSVRDRRDRL